MGLYPNSEDEFTFGGPATPSPLGVTFLSSHNPVLSLFYANHCARHGGCRQESRGIPAPKTGSLDLDGGKHEGEVLEEAALIFQIRRRYSGEKQRGRKTFQQARREQTKVWRY